MSSQTDKFCLRWNDFESNISSAFKELREDKDFFDVTLACEDDQLQAHKVILSACSPFFKTVLRRNRHEHPLLYLKGVKYQELVAVLNFMYHGEVNVAQEELNSFLAVAEELKVKGLTQNGSSSSKNSSSSAPIPSPSFQRPAPPPISPQASKRPRASPPTPTHIDLQIAPVKCEPIALPTNTPDHPSDTVNPSMYMEEYAGYEEGYDDNSEEVSYDDSAIVHGAQNADGNKDLLHVIKSMSMKVRTEDSMGWCWRCTMCDYFSANQTNLTNHIEKNHLDQCYFCPKCSKEFRSRHALKIHIQRLHDDEPQCCVICAKMFPSRKTLKAHVKSHSMQPAMVAESHSIMQQVLMPPSPYNAK